MLDDTCKSWDEDGQEKRKLMTYYVFILKRMLFMCLPTHALVRLGALQINVLVQGHNIIVHCSI